MQYLIQVKKILSHPLFEPLRRPFANQGTCLMYHRVTEELPEPSKFQPRLGLAVHVDSFEEQMRYVRQKMNPVSLDQVVDSMRGGSLEPRSVAVTFDDGYRDNLTLALPILEKYNIPATIYVATGLLDRSAPLWWFEHVFLIENTEEINFTYEGIEYSYDTSSLAGMEKASTDLDILFKSLKIDAQIEVLEKMRKCCSAKFTWDDEMLSGDELRTLAQHPLITIGGHTHSHSNCLILTQEELIEEVRENRDFLTKEIGHQPIHFAYPYGGVEHAGKREFDVISNLGFVSSATTRWGHLKKRQESSVSVLPRVNIDYFDTLVNFSWKLSGFEYLLNYRSSDEV